MKNCLKQIFETKSDADLEKALINQHISKKLTYSYLCNDCGSYHLTSRDNRIKKMMPINRSKIKERFNARIERIIRRLVVSNKLSFEYLT
tara:strand:- start:61 stop:330 length:270 start_codon:yes stop_codon:yes gene_type:complete